MKKLPSIFIKDDYNVVAVVAVTRKGAYTVKVPFHRGAGSAALSFFDNQATEFIAALLAPDMIGKTFYSRCKADNIIMGRVQQQGTFFGPSILIPMNVTKQVARAICDLMGSNGFPLIIDFNLFDYDDP